jgi:CheY-like chemotaxis protein
VVEDDVPSRAGVCLLLARQGYATSEAGNGHEALDRLRQGPPPGLILLDLLMPVMDGYEFRRRQLEDVALAWVPVVVVSGIAGGAESASLGDVARLLKPVSTSELLAAVERHRAPRLTGVLVVDDEPLVVRMLEAALRHFGFAVWSAAGGTEAVRVFRQQRGSIDVVLLDVQMPPPDGPRTYTLLREIDPTVRCVFMSGHAGIYSCEDLLRLGAACVLSKPFASLAGLAGALRRAAR